VLICTSAQVNRGPKTAEEVLDEADGLDWKTLVRCDRIYLIDKCRFEEKKGNVTRDRRTLVSRKIVEAFRFPLARD
jgi:mRNA-degrading endonuclease toxin of MazEF toxin-antitoxin module